MDGVIVAAGLYGLVFILVVFKGVAAVRSGRLPRGVAAVIFALVVAAPPWIFQILGATHPELWRIALQSLILGAIGFGSAWVTFSRVRPRRS